jgi:methylmalonyl-CoA/ethylmalonyl-CoA epimerase
MHFEHIGVAVSNIKESLSVFNNLFELNDVSEIYEDTFQNIKISFFCFAGVKIELIEPLDSSKKSPVDNIIEKNVSYYHLCFRTGCIEDEISQLVEKGAIVVTEPIPSLAFSNRRIAFLYVNHLGLIELVEKEE